MEEYAVRLLGSPGAVYKESGRFINKMPNFNTYDIAVKFARRVKFIKNCVEILATIWIRIGHMVASLLKVGKN